MMCNTVFVVSKMRIIALHFHSSCISKKSKYQNRNIVILENICQYSFSAKGQRVNMSNLVGYIVTVETPQLQSSPRHCVNEWVYCVPITPCLWTLIFGYQIVFCVCDIILLLVFSQPFKNIKPIFNSNINSHPFEGMLYASIVPGAWSKLP